MVAPMVDYIRLQSIHGIGHKRLNKIFLKLAETKQTPDAVFNMPASTLAEEFDIPPKIAEAIAQTPVPPQELLAQLESKGIRLLSKDNPEYPERVNRILGDDAPPLLYVWGNLDLLRKPTVGFCGSREVTESGVTVISSAVRQITSLDWTVVSGHARGTDTIAHRVTLEHGGGTIVVAPQGILGFKLRQDLRAIAKPEKLLVVSEFFPTAPWSIANAMARNKTILAFSDAMILIEARLSGGTFDAGKTALRLKVPLYVAEYQFPGENADGNTYFLSKGAVPLRKNRETGDANIEPLREAVLNKREASTTDPQSFLSEGEIVAAPIPKQLAFLELETPLV